LLMSALRKVKVQMNDICDTRPMLLNEFKRMLERRYGGLVIPLMGVNPTISSFFVIWPDHVTDQRDRLVRPNDNILL
jgi:hypothetical protein